MAVLGLDGRLELVREQLEEETFAPSALVAPSKLETLLGTAYWTGDRVAVYCAGGLPTVNNALGEAQWGGVGPYERGPTRVHLTTEDASQYWRTSDGAAHWAEQDPDDPLEAEFFIHVDDFGRISFYRSFAESLVGDPTGRVEIRSLGWDALTINSAMPSEGWQFACGIRAWDFETEAAAIDTTPIGVKFGEAVKSIVKGAGSFDFQVDRKGQNWDAIKTMRFVMLTQKGSLAHAKFVLTPDDGEYLNPASIYYDADIMLVACSVSVRLEDAIVGSARFVTTKDIDLRLGPV